MLSDYFAVKLVLLFFFASIVVDKKQYCHCLLINCYCLLPTGYMTACLQKSDL